MGESVSQLAEKPLTARQTERRQRILAAAQMLVARDGYEAVTMRGIAIAAGTAEKTLYNIFGSKDRLVALAAHDRSEMIFEIAAQAAGGPGWERLRGFCVEANKGTHTQPRLSRAMAMLLLDHSELVGLHAIYAQFVADDVLAMIADGLLRAETPVSDVVRTIRLGIVASVVFWTKGELANAEFEGWLVRQCAQALLPWATPTGHARLLAEIVPDLL